VARWELTLAECGAIVVATRRVKLIISDIYICRVFSEKIKLTLNGMMKCFIHNRLINLGFTKYTYAKDLYFARFWHREYGTALPLFTQFASGHRVLLRIVEYYLKLSSAGRERSVGGPCLSTTASHHRPSRRRTRPEGLHILCDGWLPI